MWSYRIWSSVILSYHNFSHDRPPFDTMGSKYLRLLAALALVNSVKSSCLVEDKYDYFNLDNVNWGPSNPQPDWESCRSSCETSHPTATHFVYIKFGTWTENCWCKTSKSGRTSNSNKVSGEVCRGKKIVTFITSELNNEKSETFGWAFFLWSVFLFFPRSHPLNIL